MGKTLGEEWKALDATEKSKYEDMAKKDKKRYEDAKAAYNVSFILTTNQYDSKLQQADAEEEDASD